MWKKKDKKKKKKGDEKETRLSVREGRREDQSNVSVS